MKVPLLNFVGGPVVPLSKFKRGPGVPLLNLKGIPGRTFLNLKEGPGSRVPRSWFHFYTRSNKTQFFPVSIVEN